MKKVFLKAYCKNNLGDDLFLQIISNRYDNNFLSICSPKYKYYNRFDNIRFNKSYIEYYIYRILEKILKKKNILESKYLEDTDIILNIGGSIFIENKNDNIDTLKKRFDFYNNSIPYFILGANFGPYHNEYYKDYIGKKIFGFSKDVCFRDEYSYNLFKTTEKVRMASDIVFSLDTSSIKISNSKNVIISVIDCKNRFSNKTTHVYEKKIIDMIAYFDQLNYNVTLMSFCKAEGDEIAIKRIEKKLKIELPAVNVNKYFYKGNINEALNVIGDSQIVVGSRFHANVLGMLFDKTVIPIAYSDKTINLLKDIRYAGKIFDIRNIDELDIKNITETDLKYKLDISKQKKDAHNHFLVLDKYLNKK